MPVEDCRYVKLLAGTPYNNIVIVGARFNTWTFQAFVLHFCINNRLQVKLNETCWSDIGDALQFFEADYGKAMTGSLMCFCVSLLLEGVLKTKQTCESIGFREKYWNVFRKGLTCFIKFYQPRGVEILRNYESWIVKDAKGRSRGPF